MTTHTRNRAWKRVPIADLCETIVDCVNRTAITVSEPTPYRMIRTTNVRDGRINLTDAKCVSRETYERWTRRQVPLPGDVVLTREAPLGEVGIIRNDGPVFLGQRLVAYRADRRKTVPEFLLYSLMGGDLQGQIAALGSGATVEHMRVPDAKTLLVLLPTLEAQRRIAAILSAYDDLIDVNTRRIAILEEMARRLFDEWFVQFRFPGFEKVRFAESPLGRIPKSWKVVPLSNVCARITDGAHKSPPSEDEGVPMASVKDMTDWNLRIESCRKISRDAFGELERNDCRPQDGDVLIAKDGSYLKHVFLFVGRSEVAILSSIAILRPNGRLRSNLFVQMLRNPMVRERMKGCVTGVAIPRIVLRAFREFPILLPDMKLQDAWEACCAPMHDQCRNLTQSNRSLHAARNLLLPKLISGEIDVTRAERGLETAADQAAAE